MRPIRTEFQAFGPYAGYEAVDFESVSRKGLFLICGRTGTGKTMILDAMTFALFGKSSGHGRDDFESMRCTNADFATDTFVRFEFENQGEVYRFERRLERKRKNLSASCSVSRLGEDGIWRPLLENPKERTVNEKAVELIGLEYEQFRQVMVLPQGQFERLLTSNSDEKEKILTSIFGEEKWQRIAECFYSRAESRKNELKGIQERIRNSLAEEDCVSIGELSLKTDRKKEEEETLTEEYKRKDYEGIIRREQEKLTDVRRFGDLHRAEERAALLAAQREKRIGWEKKAENAKRAEKVRIRLEEEQRAKEVLSRRLKEEDSIRKTAEEKRKASEEASEQAALHARKEQDIEERKTRKIRYEGKRGDYEGLEEAERLLKVRERAAKDALTAETKTRKECGVLSEAVSGLQKEYAGLHAEQGTLLNRYLAGITGELAEQLAEGKPCPVCGSTEHPHRAKAAPDRVSRAEVEEKKKAADRKYQELQEETAALEKAKKHLDEKHAALEKANTELAAFSAALENRRKNLIEGIATAGMLEEEIEKLQKSVTEYEAKKKQLLEAQKQAKDACTEAEAKIEPAGKETEAAEKLCRETAAAVEEALRENGFSSREEAEEWMLTREETEELSARISDYDANVKNAGETLKALREELQGKEEPDGESCREALRSAEKAREDYIARKAVLSGETERLLKKLRELRKEGEDIGEKLREAEEDFAFAKKLRGDSGTGLQRYALGIMFSSVVAAANQMLEMVHGGRYRLYRSDEKAQGTNKRGLELKVFDRNSTDHDGRFVSTLSGGEKFLASLALSIGLSTVAQKSGIRIEALFIDEGFGSLDDESIGDAMNVLNSIQKANGLVGIISHVQILQEQIPVKLKVEKDSRGSHIVQTIG